jgi:hypothetical protein
MQTIQQVQCPRCQELNDLQEEFCLNCGLPLRRPAAPTVQVPPPVSIPAPRQPDLLPLMITLVSLFGAFWGCVAAGLLTSLVAFVTHPILVIFATLFALVMTGLRISERILKEPPPRAMLTTNDAFILSWTLAALLGVGMLLKNPFYRAMPAIVRSQPMSDAPDGCRVEVWFTGRPGDELWRLTEFRKTGETNITGVVVRRRDGGSVHLQTTYRTPQGKECAIGKYHLLVVGQEIDNVDGF